MAPLTLLCLVLLFLLLRSPRVHRFALRALRISNKNRMKRYQKARSQRVRGR